MLMSEPEVRGEVQGLIRAANSPLCRQVKVPLFLFKANDYALYILEIG